MLQSMTILAQYKNTYRTTWILLNMFMQTNSSANRNGTRILDAPHIINHPRAEIPPAKFNTPIPRFFEKMVSFGTYYPGSSKAEKSQMH